MLSGTLGGYPMPFKRQIPVSSDRVLSTQDLNGLIIVDSTAGPVLITLPFANTIRAGGFFQILAVKGATNPVTVLFQAGNTYNDGQIAPLTLDQDGQNLLILGQEAATTWLALLSAAVGGGGGGGGNWFQDAIWVDGGTLVAPVDQDGTMGAPLSTIQAAVLLAEAKMDALPPMVDGAAPAGTRNRQRQVIVVAGGIYDEDVASLRGNMFLELLACGPVTLGDAAAGTPVAGNFDSTVPRSLTWFNSQTVEDADLPGAVGEDDDRRPTLVLGVFPQFGEMSSTHTAIASGWVISGDLIFTSAASSTCEFHAQNVKVVGLVDGTADLGARNCYIYRCKFAAFDWASGGSSNGALLQIVESTEFDGLTNVLRYGRMVHCEIDGGFTVGGFSAGLPPGGMFGCDFAGTFTSPGPLQMDAATNFFFVANGASLAGGAVKVLMHSLA